jgi:hypothetical protein
MKHSQETRNDLIEICRKQHKNDEAENKKIDDFEQIYTPNQAVLWYTKDSFVYRLLNKALRTENIDIIYKVRSFITDLHRQFNTILNDEPAVSSSVEICFYRGWKLPIDEFKKLQENVNGHLSMNTFMSVFKIELTSNLKSAMSFLTAVAKMKFPENAITHQINIL